jgi:DNA-binding IclR family transcriptional regulator
MSVPRTQSLSRAIALLRALEHFPRGVSTAELGRVTGLAPATAARLLATLADAGFVERDDARWTIGAELVRIAQRADPERALAGRARPVLAELAAAAKESAMLAVPRPGPRVLVIAQADGPRLLGLTNWVGRPIDLHASAAGKLLLADLDDRAVAAWIRRERPRRLTPRTLSTRSEILRELARVRAEDWAEIDGESEVGLASVAVPVRDPEGSLVALLGYSGPAERLDRPALVPTLRHAATRLAWTATEVIEPRLGPASS